MQRRRFRDQRPAAHQLILIRLHSEPEHVSIQGITLLIHRRLTPAAWLVAKLGARWDRGTQSGNLHDT